MIAWVVLIVALAITFAFSYKETSNVECKGIEIVSHKKQKVYISNREILNLVRNADKDLIGKKLNDINAETIEAEVKKHNTILKASVYKMVVKDSIRYKGVLGVKVKYREPVMRVITSDASYYMDSEGVRFPTSINYSANVMLVTGNVSEELARKSLLPMVGHLAEDDFWKAQIKQIHVDRNDELLLTPLVGNQVIEFGTADNYTAKLRNLLAFYQEVVSDKNWDKYDRISLKYKNQIIAKKRD